MPEIRDGEGRRDGGPRPRRLVLASGNAGKQREFALLLAELGIELVLQSSLGIAAAEETGTTFEQNALLKARHAAHRSSLPALADDSGLEVDALGGRPGVYSARYAGATASDEDNNRRLLTELAPFGPPARGARYVCVLALVRRADDPAPVLARGTWEGVIAATAAGHGGFGYDPLFVPRGMTLHAAQLRPELKNRLSHRGQAAEQLLRQLRAVQW
ncbi:MAG: RdgB/HAM1 family non-canonical purine NTP pyrophosphatase [Steroidobacteraceae bacterium]